MRTIYYITDGSQIPRIPTHQTKCFIIKMPSAAHQTVVVEFTKLLQRKLEDIGAGSNFEERQYTEDMGNISRKPSGSWGLQDKDYATGVISVKLSKSTKRLPDAAHLWIDHPESHVHQVITAKIRPDKPEIIFQGWEDSNHGYVTRGHPRQAISTQEAKVELKNNRSEADGPIHLSYSQILEEPPPEGTPDDIVVTPDDLAEIAEEVWFLQNFIKQEEWLRILEARDHKLYR